MEVTIFCLPDAFRAQMAAFGLVRPSKASKSLKTVFNCETQSVFFFYIRKCFRAGEAACSLIPREVKGRGKGKVALEDVAHQV